MFGAAAEVWPGVRRLGVAAVVSGCRDGGWMTAPINRRPIPTCAGWATCAAADQLAGCSRPVP